MAGVHAALHEITQITAIGAAGLVRGFLLRQLFEVGAAVQLLDDVLGLVFRLGRDLAGVDFFLRHLGLHGLVIGFVQLFIRHGRLADLVEVSFHHDPLIRHLLGALHFRIVLHMFAQRLLVGELA